MITFNVNMDNLSPDKSITSMNSANMDIDTNTGAVTNTNSTTATTTSGDIGETEGGKKVPLELTAYGTTPSGKPRLFVCQVCTRAFARLEHLRRHERSHTKEKPFTCGVCQRKFSRRDLLLRHAQKLHAGCADAITRLRRKSVKRASEDMSMGDDSPTSDQVASPSSSNLNSSANSSTNANNNTHGNNDINFNLNLFGSDSLSGQMQNIPHINYPPHPSSSNTSSQSPSIPDRASQTHRQPLALGYPNSNIHALGHPHISGFSHNNGNRVSHSNSNSTSHSQSNSMSGLSPFPLQRSQSQLSQYSTAPFKKSRRNSDMSKSAMSRGRGASFSAQSGPNYAVNVPEFNDLYPGAENVEFSTPQLIPSQTYDESSWLNNLSQIPGMSSDDKDKKLDLNNLRYMMPTATMNDDIKSHETGRNNDNHSKNNNDGSKNHHGTGTTLGSGNFPINKTSNHNTPDSNLPQNETDNDKEFYGYSFYDIPESMTSRAFPSEYRLHSNLTPIKQEFEEDHLNLQLDSPHSNHNRSNNQSHPLNSDFDLNFINDIGELANEIDINSKFLSNGYSFYGDNPSVSSSNVDSPGPGSGNVPTMAGNALGGSGYTSLTPNSNASHLNANNPNYINQSQLLNIENTNNLNNLKLTNYSKNKMFTNNLRTFINRTLDKYPINGVTNPIIPSNEKLEYYLQSFIEKFLSHFAFIHVSKLNEYEIMNMTNNEDYGNESSRACLPLLMATIGALLSNNKNDSEHLYEASRRTIHIYLETRKQSNESKNNPLWLIQSLTLSVIYGLFSDNENNVFIVIRQLNALNSLVKTSIKEKQKLNSKIFFSINKDDESKLMRDSKMRQTDNISEEDKLGTSKSESGGSLFADHSIEDETRFTNNINLQSQFRIIFIIYRVTNFLLVFYNIPLTLSINDLNNLEIPSKSDEMYWSFKNYQNYKEFNHILNGSNNNNNLNLTNVMGSKAGSGKNKLIFKDLLLKISKNSNMNFSNSNSLKCLNNLSKFGYITLIHGIFEINQFNNNLNTINILNNLSMFLKSEPIDYQVIDYSILNNFIKISSVIDFKLLKQQSWLKNYQELLKYYEKLLNSIKLNEFSKIDKILDYCLIILKFLLLRVEKFKYNKSSLSQSEANNLHDRSGIENEEEDSEEVEDIDDLSFERILDIKFSKDLNPGHELNVILSQCIFHVFSILSILLLLYIKSVSTLPNYKLVLRKKFRSIFSFLNYVQMSLNLPTIYQLTLNVNHDDFDNSGANNNHESVDPNIIEEDSLLPTNDPQLGNDDGDNLNFSNILYLLNVGELLLLQTFNNQLKFSIFEKLSINLSQIRKFLINNEHRLGGF